MNSRHKFIFFVMFCLSGFCGLAYQIVWLRKAFAFFGVITPIISVVVSVFMLGLFLGSWAGGKWIKKITQRLSISAIYVYALAEIIIGIGGVSVPYLFSIGDRVLLPIGSTGSFIYLLFSGVVIAITMLPWCIFMGTTYPFMMAFLEEHYPDEKNGFSFLYLANVIGAMLGTLFTALFLIELFGFQHTLFIAACMNFTVALLAVFLGITFRKQMPGLSDTSKASSDAQQIKASFDQPSTPYLTRSILFITGFSSMGMEVIWSRAFTPAMGTFIYSFALLLFTYLLATGIGSYVYRRHRDKHLNWSVSVIIALLSVSVFLPVILTDWRVPFFSRLPVLNIFPFCFLLGYLTPQLIDQYSGGNPERAGTVYAINIAGCVLGPLAASYLLLPFFGSRISLIILSLPILWLFMKHWSDLKFIRVWRAVFTSVLAVAIFCSIFISISFEEGFIKDGVIRHDYTATIVSYGYGSKKGLLVNGVGMTYLGPVQKDMAHVPLAFLNHKPESALAICMGMGTTLRSLASWGIDVTVVELVPGVKDAFGYYFKDADQVLSKPNVRIIIDDGRRFLRRTDKKFDVITIDPPPPPEAAGSSLLYSEEFYSLIRMRLKEGGIVQQFYPYADKSSAWFAVVNSLKRLFPYVVIIKPIENNGYHFFASMNPINIPTATEAVSRMPEAARKDRLEWDDNSPMRLMDIWTKLLNGSVAHPLLSSSYASITDDKPFNEYYVVRSVKEMGYQSLISWIANYLKNKPGFYIRYNPYSLSAEDYCKMGSTYGKEGLYIQAIKYSSQSINLNKNNIIAYNNRGVFYRKLNRHHLAIKDFDKAISLEKNCASAYANRGLSYLAIGNNNFGCIDLKKACSMGICVHLEWARNKGLCH